METKTTFTPHPELPPPANTVGAVGWLRANLFSSPANSLLTLFALYLLWLLLPPALEWLLFKATWSGTTRADCAPGGACWVFIKMRFGQFMYGFFPEPERWRVNLAWILAVLGILPLLGKRNPLRLPAAVFMLFVYPLIAFVLFSGGFGLAPVETSQWGGLMLTLVIAVVGIAGALPGGILLALGRRSKMPVIKTICVTFIEFWRGVPLITVLFMSSVMLPLFLPEGMSFDKLLRALIGVILFQSAYMAEVVRGGLQAIPKGQYEAADALGLSYPKAMGLVILPQALKLVIPGIVNTLIALFKDTSLVIIIGLFDLLNSIHAATVDPNWLGMSTEGYVFAALMFWLFCFGMSQYSQWLERRLHTGHKR
ncbi:amino acid ABC transporter membrane protein 2 (PAAT family) [Plasticicumulans lactativorans]|uniref:Amino acid ABC transporter membrane protein 2 (PAAT family) n=1 Tax=Plasticicumulans lactativorans TaxID=1133106 RepID=A0A4R2L990_9GAMM|nr:amino acid ABC transporter permease [Plasticicumulans lactativorans]TCO83331.1 amino acid ABC transporter membrane protein 2 (PAAT family) [Plasticicumulans lactativorans]